MTSWYSNILTRTTSQISSLRATLLSSDADGDTEDDTHVCRVLRNYYNDKGRPLPPWLPPDPKAAVPVPQTLYAQPQAGSRYGLGAPQQQGGGAAGGPLSSLWDSAGPSSGPPPSRPQNLRAGRSMPVGMMVGTARGGGGGGGGGGGVGVGGGAPPPPPPASAWDDGNGARPLPSQRAGSYQPAAAGAVPAGTSAQERLRQRFWGGTSSRTQSPLQNSVSQQGPFQPPGGGAGAGAAPSSYDDRYAPDSAYDAGGGGGGGDPRQGLPTFSRRQGLPNGPRGYR
ncbi:hypothetical protein DCS_02793 [Drechmeria coniospora]|uniref:Mso1 N-terminal domain-containing protein n=1 Tax=Drechmeria coniospora TaxID=98403 RepID=A0A151GX42_DRECN|nr:hypothetical protein DCS_02793 [Drechmeria coniospora]KYK61650.1 hypothetical protein DCS_02793 [Drechmeria coniospora]